MKLPLPLSQFKTATTANRKSFLKASQGLQIAHSMLMELTFIIAMEGVMEKIAAPRLSSADAVEASEPTGARCPTLISSSRRRGDVFLSRLIALTHTTLSVHNSD
ncbi:hypothetical protein CEXT_706561 [Caerostris extrusa]|uniref:Uncharacterized protein n=1 Tax=Caerostris extrusa TaxID=172846 RepID=A0AAV4XP48_CAEEX|nr:hypothetical protein CEXT_706561 [Caerostris extrusa]